MELLTEHHLEFLKGGCTDSSESTLVKMPHYSKSHVKLIYSLSKAEEWFLSSQNHYFSVLMLCDHTDHLLSGGRLSNNLHYINTYATSVTLCRNPSFIRQSPVTETSPDLQHVRTCRLTYCNHLTWPHVWVWINEKMKKKSFSVNKDRWYEILINRQR